MNSTLKKNFSLIVLLLYCITIVSCAKKEPELRKVNKSEHNTNQLQKEIESELYDTSGQNNLEWGADIVADAGRWSKNLVANERYMFFITKSQIIRCDRRTNKKKIIVQCDEETDIKLCLDDKFLYYLLNGENIFRVDFSGDETKKVVSLNVLKKNGIRISSISGMKIYHNKLYLYEIIYGYVIEFTPEKNKIKLIAKCVRDADFFNESLYYVDESKRCIYKVNLETGKEEVARQG